MIAQRLARPLAVAAAVATTTLLLQAAPLAVAEPVPAMAEPSPRELKDQTLAAVNAARAKYGAGPLTWSDDLHPGAEEHAIKCKYEHSASEGKYGEAMYGSSAYTANVGDAVKAWIEQGSAYDYSKPGLQSETRYFSQLVWKSTSKISIAVATCPAGSILPKPMRFFVARFTEAGNMPGQFEENVGRPVT
ncbi:CAP domain-containing protein [Streptomyces sp. NPDC005533]|uniref:CAP domain-containing protein n=1 Tax=Streptomyces sp. NPDC005533 TaxID=3364723 RepID=UPI0036B5A4CB